MTQSASFALPNPYLMCGAATFTYRLQDCPHILFISAVKRILSWKISLYTVSQSKRPTRINHILITTTTSPPLILFLFFPSCFIGKNLRSTSLPQGVKLFHLHSITVLTFNICQYWTANTSAKPCVYNSCQWRKEVLMRILLPLSSWFFMNSVICHWSLSFDWGQSCQLLYERGPSSYI